MLCTLAKSFPVYHGSFNDLWSSSTAHGLTRSLKLQFASLHTVNWSRALFKLGYSAYLCSFTLGVVDFGLTSAPYMFNVLEATVSCLLSTSCVKRMIIWRILPFNLHAIRVLIKGLLEPEARSLSWRVGFSPKVISHLHQQHISTLAAGPQSPYATADLSTLSNSNVHLPGLPHGLHYGGNMSQLNNTGLSLNNRLQSCWTSHTGLIHGDHSSLINSILPHHFPHQNRLSHQIMSPQQLQQQKLHLAVQPSLGHFSALPISIM
ncbi:hypothetical protein BC332_18636 [Capsicum chinense]|nr:hypothetical protein BC332_18636 [Capsicum chinense]